MRQILIDRKALDLAKHYAELMKPPKEKSLFEDAKANIIALKTRFDGKTVKVCNGDKEIDADWSVPAKHDYVGYLDLLINKQEVLTTLTPDCFEACITDFEGKVSHADVNKPLMIEGVKESKTFASMVHEAMLYKKMRSAIYPKVMKGFGIKACVYCNANYTITDSRGNGYYDLDHWKPKSLYPFLCTTFFNLQPCCASCNRHKSNDDKGEYLQLWTCDGSKPLDSLSIDLTHHSISKYLVSGSASDLMPVFKECAPEYKQMRDDMNKKLHIEEIYKQHTDVAEEIIWKSRAYSESYLDTLRQLAKNVVPNEAEVNRFILGNYDKAEDIHKRPLAAFMQSIGKQLGLIKDE